MGKWLTGLKILIIGMLASFSAFAAENVIPEDYKTGIKQRYIDSDQKYQGEVADGKLSAWKYFVEQTRKKNLSELELVYAVNDFFHPNRVVKFRLDKSFWNRSDYWAKPTEFVGWASGDCEDFAFAKYYTLLVLGIPDEKLRVTYTAYYPHKDPLRQSASSRAALEYHMVLTYSPDGKANNKLVLDNINPKITKLNDRKDLKLLKPFRGTYLFRNKKGAYRVKLDKNEFPGKIFWKEVMKPEEYNLRK